MKRLTMRDRTPAKAKRPPPSFTTAFADRWRMICLFVALFLAMKLYDITRQPDAWRWFERLTSDVAPSQIDTKLPPTAVVAEVREGIIAHPNRPIITKYTAADVPEKVPEKIDPFDRVWRESWRDIFQHLNYAERSLFYRGLKAVRDDRPLAEEFRQPHAELRKRVDDAWSAYRIEATAGMKDLPDEEKAVWLDLLQRTGSKWSAELFPAFESIAQGVVPSEPHKKSLVELQTLLDSILMAMVQDNTFWRAEEAEISFRLFELASQQKPADEKLANQATFVQLFQQAADYRGTTVHVRGRAKQAWHVKAPSNWVGITGYYVFIVRPDDSNSPIVVYSLELPPGFPDVKDKDVDAATTSLDDEMEFTGIFLKRWAYTGRGGAYAAPLIISKVGKWTPPPKGLGDPMTPAEMQRSLSTTGGILAVLGFAVLLGWYFWPRSAPRELPTSEELQPALTALQDQPLTTIAEELQRLEAEATKESE